MKIIRGMELHNESREEKLPDFAPDFPYIASRVELDYFRESSAPWHWHRAVELFYIESGELKYRTPNAVEVFQAGSGGLINSNVLHMTEFQRYGGRNIQLIHLFEPSLIAGPHDGLIDRKYVVPLLTSRLEMIALHPEEPEQADILRLIRQAFELTEEDFGYELLLREALARIWLKLLHLSPSALQKQPRSSDRSTEQIKRMLTYIHEHFSEKISVRDLAASAFLSERECYRVFQTCLHMTPVEYLRSFRLQQACRMLAEGKEPVTAVGYACGLGSPSYFGKCFRSHTGCTPLEYRRKWQNPDKI